MSATHVPASSGPPVGLVVVDKPAGLTSHDVVARVRRLAGTRKVGHAGTLDPMATGVLVVGVNRATRLLGHLMLTDKAYDAVIRLGWATITDDAEGEALEIADPVAHRAALAGADDEAIRLALVAQTGDIEQVPTSVSAIKVDGKRAYARVRAGEEVEIPSRPVTVHAIDVHAIDRYLDAEDPQGGHIDVAISVRCSSGTYIRAIARDLGRALGVGGHLTTLRRTAVGACTLADSRSLEQLAERFDMMPIAETARATFPSVDLGAEQARAVRFGRPLDLDLEGLSAVFDPAGDFLALYEPREGRACPVAVFVG